MSGDLDLDSMISVIEHCVEAKCCEKKDYDKALIPGLMPVRSKNFQNL
jgi:hypothetical protein